VRFVGRGHPNIRATHEKTFELTPDTEVSERATCVIAVDVRSDGGGPCAGPVELTVRVGDHTHRVRAGASSSWQPGSTAVVRRSPMQLPGTFATSADTSAAELPRALVSALQSHDTVVEVEVAPAPPTRRTVVLCSADPSRPADARLRAELATADRIVAEDTEARAIASPRNGAGSRTLVVATRELPGASVLAELGNPKTDVETIGMPPQLAAAAACPSRAAVVIAADQPVKALRTAPATHRVLAPCAPHELPDFLETAGELRPGSLVTIAQLYAPPIRVCDGAVPQLPAEDRTYCCVAPAASSRAIDPSVHAAVRALLADGVSTRTAARALAELAHLTRRDAYDTVLEMSRTLH
jgi:hypothetical protein